MGTSWREVPYTGGRDASAPIAWGQQTTWDDIHYFLPDTLSFFVLKRAVPVPRGLSLDEVLDEVGELVGRHESVRTLFSTDDSGRITQHVAASGSVRAVVVELDAEPDAEALQLIVEDVAGLWFDHAVELPLRLGVVVVDGRPTDVVLGLSHVSVDMQAMVMLMTELADLLAARAAGTARPPRVPVAQPVDVAGWEGSDKGQRKNEAALSQLRRQLEVVPATMFADPGKGESPRYWRGCLVSRAVPMALRVLDERYKGGISAILLATNVLLLEALTGSDQVTVGLVYSNRSTAENRPVIGTLSQTVTTTLTRGTGSFGDLVSRAWSSSLRSYMHARFDSRAERALVAEVGRDRSVGFDLTCRFNDTWSWRLAEKPEGAVIDRATVTEAQRHSTFLWQDKTDLDKITFYVDIGGDQENIRLNLLADTRRVPPASIEAFLRGWERALLALVEKELCLDHVVAASGLLETPFLGRTEQAASRDAFSCSCEAAV